jgi:hypothetical protein
MAHLRCEHCGSEWKRSITAAKAHGWLVKVISSWPSLEEAWTCWRCAGSGQSLRNHDDARESVNRASLPAGFDPRTGWS